MRYLYRWLFCISFLYSAKGFSQSSQGMGGGMVDIGQGKAIKYVDEVSFNGMDLNNKISYSRIKGSPFWKEEWKEADLFTTFGKIGTSPVKINLATNEIYFKRNDEVWVLTDQDVVKVIFKNDSIELVRNLPNLFLKGKPVENFVEVKNSGRYQLLKLMDRKIASADSLFGTQKRYFFKDDVYYFIRTGDKIQFLKKWNEESFLELMPGSSQDKTWIKAQQLNLKQEADMVKFLNYYNAKGIESSGNK